MEGVGISLGNKCDDKCDVVIPAAFSLREGGGGIQEF